MRRLRTMQAMEAYYTDLERREREALSSERARQEVQRLQQVVIQGDVAVATWKKLAAMLLAMLIAALYVLVMEGEKYVQ